MNSGPIAHRYAKALLKYIQETGAGEKVYSQACVLALRIQEIPALAEALQNHQGLSFERKIKLMEAAVGTTLENEILRFVALVYAQKRMNYLLRMFYSFIEQYRQANSIKVGRLVTACPVLDLKERLQTVLSERYGATVLLEEELNPDIIGGFVFELDGYRMDASVEGQLAKIRRQLVQNNNRIV